MNVKIKETGEVKELRINASDTGIEWTQDLIGNAGAMNDGQFVWSSAPLHWRTCHRYRQPVRTQTGATSA